MKLTKLQQQKLNKLSEEKRGLEVAVKMLAKDYGNKEVEFWKFVEELAGDRIVCSVDYAGKNSKITFEK